MENEDPYRRQAPWPPRSKVKVAMSHGASVSRQRKVPETPKLVGRLPIPSVQYCAPVSGSKGQRSRSLGRLIIRPKVCHIFRVGRPTKFNLGTPTDPEGYSGYPHGRSKPLPGWWGITELIYTNIVHSSIAVIVFCYFGNITEHRILYTVSRKNVPLCFWL